MNNEKMNMSSSGMYVCPMHPEERSDKPGKCGKCGMDLVMQKDKNENKSQMHDHNGHMEHDHSKMMMGDEAARGFLRRFMVVSVLLIPLLLTSELAVKWLGVPDFGGRQMVQFIIATVIFEFGLVFFEHAKHEIMARSYGMMTLVSIAVGAGYAFSVASTFLPGFEGGFYLEISTLIWVLLFGHYLEAKSSTAAGDALGEVAKLLPQTAHLVKGKDVVEVKVSELKVDEVVVVKPGEKIPADGEIREGEANFDESLISGESKPVKKKKGDKVAAGSIVLDGSVRVVLTEVGENSTVGQIAKLIEEAGRTKPSAQSLADRAAAWLTFVALGVAILTLLVWSVLLGQSWVFSITLAITVLVIACPHALGLAIPTVSTIATKLAVKNGLFVKNMKKLEIAKGVDWVVFDKTGTLTKGKFGVREVQVWGKMGEEDLLGVVRGLEEESSHVIGESIVEYIKGRKIGAKKISDFKNLAGMGIAGKMGRKRYWVGNVGLMKKNKVWTKEAEEKYGSLVEEGNTVVMVADEEVILGALVLGDEIKEESREAVKRLHDLNIKIAMLTGDSKEVAAGVAEKLGIDTFFAGVLPEDKYKKVKELQTGGVKVMMVGDGVNDAPALKQADVGVAVGAGTEVAVEAGDVVLTHSNPMSVVNLVVLSRKVYRKMIENLVWALGYNLVAIPAAAGLFIPVGLRLSPSVGAFLMSLSSVIVVVNALGLQKAKLD